MKIIPMPLKFLEFYCKQCYLDGWSFSSTARQIARNTGSCEYSSRGLLGRASPRRSGARLGLVTFTKLRGFPRNTRQLSDRIFFPTTDAGTSAFLGRGSVLETEGRRGF